MTTNQQPTKKEIIEAIKRNKEKKQKWNKRNEDQIRFQSKTDRQPQPSINPPSLERQIIKRINDQPIDPRISPLIDSRCRYWVENRISQLLASNNFTTRSGYSFSIDNDRTNGGLCFRFMNNGTTIVRIDSRGYIYCANVVIGKTSISSLLEQLQNTNANMALYVKHQELKNGTYDLNVHDIDSNELHTNRVRIYRALEASGNNCLTCYDNTDPDDPINRVDLFNYGRIRCELKIPNPSNILCIVDCFAPDMPDDSSVYIRLGKEIKSRNIGLITYKYAGDGSINNYMGLGFYNNNNHFKFYPDRFNLNENRRIIMGSTNDTQTSYYISCANDSTSKDRFRVAHSGELILNTTNYGEWVKPITAYCDDITAGRHVLLQWGKSATKGNCCYASFTYAGNDSNNNFISLGFQQYDNRLVLYRDRMNIVVPTKIAMNNTKNVDTLTIEGTSAFTTNDYYRQVFTDGTKTGYLTFTKDTQYYKMKLGIDGATGCLTVNETGIEMDGDVDIHNDLILWNSLYVKDINEAYAGENINLHNLTTINLTSNDADNRALNIIDPNLLGNSLSINIGIDDGTTAERNAYIKWYNSNITLSNRLAFGISGIGDILSIFKGFVHINKRLDMSLSDYTSHPIDIFTYELNNGETSDVKVNDGNDASLNGLGKDSNGDYYSYMKLENGTAEIDVYSNKTNINDDLNVNGKIDTPNKSTAANALGSDLQKAIIDLVYPIGSYYMSGVELSGTKYMDGATPKIDWMGCVWSPVSSHIFFRSSNVSISGNTWSYSDGGATGGEDEHILTIDEMPNHTHSPVWLYNTGATSWHSDSQPRVSYGYWDQNYSTMNFGGMSSKGNDQPHNNLPPYQNIYIYQRVA